MTFEKEKILGTEIRVEFEVETGRLRGEWTSWSVRNILCLDCGLGP